MNQHSNAMPSKTSASGSEPNPVPDTPKKHLLISYDEWVEQYKPKANPDKADAPYDGHMLETYGPEFEQVRTAADDCIWTLLDGEFDSPTIGSGFARVNRIGYFITEVPAPADQFVSVIDEPEDYLKFLRRRKWITGDPKEHFELSPEFQAAWDKISSRVRRPKP